MPKIPSLPVRLRSTQVSKKQPDYICSTLTNAHFSLGSMTSATQVRRMLSSSFGSLQSSWMLLRRALFGTREPH